LVASNDNDHDEEEGDDSDAFAIHAADNVNNDSSSFVDHEPVPTPSLDHASYPAPLTECFIATAGHRLVSSVRRYPARVVEATESAY
jgi:hypothetical protein